MRKNTSAVKKNQVANRNRIRNKVYKSLIKTATNKYLSNINNTNLLSLQDISVSLALVYKNIDKAVKRGVLHKNKAARKKSRLAKMMKIKMVSSNE